MTSAEEYVWKPIEILPEPKGLGVVGEAIIISINSDRSIPNTISVQYYFLNSKNMISFDKEITTTSDLVSTIKLKKKFSKTWKTSMIRNLFDKQRDKYTKDYTKDFIEWVTDIVNTEPNIKRYFG
jgi:hypothetical protein